MKLRKHLAMVALLGVMAATGASFVGAASAGAQPGHNCGPNAHWTGDGCEDNIRKTPPPPPPPPPPPTHTVCDPFCNEYFSRSATRATSAWFDSNANTLQASVGGGFGVACAAIGLASGPGGLVCAAFGAFTSIDLAFTIDRYHQAAANNQCIQLPKYVPWSYPVPYDGAECWN